jgi:hypothetical protein
MFQFIFIFIVLFSEYNYVLNLLSYSKFLLTRYYTYLETGNELLNLLGIPGFLRTKTKIQQAQLILSILFNFLHIVQLMNNVIWKLLDDKMSRKETAEKKTRFGEIIRNSWNNFKLNWKSKSKSNLKKYVLHSHQNCMLCEELNKEIISTTNNDPNNLSDFRSGGKQFRGRNDKYCDFSDEASLSNISFKTLRRSVLRKYKSENLSEEKIKQLNRILESLQLAYNPSFPNEVKYTLHFIGDYLSADNSHMTTFLDEFDNKRFPQRKTRKSANEAIFREWCVEYKITTFNNTKININTTKKKRVQFNLKVDVVLFDTQLVEKEIESLMDIMIDVIVMCRPCTYNY